MSASRSAISCRMTWTPRRRWWRRRLPAGAQIGTFVHQPDDVRRRFGVEAMRCRMTGSGNIESMPRAVSIASASWSAMPAPGSVVVAVRDGGTAGRDDGRRRVVTCSATPRAVVYFDADHRDRAGDAVAAWSRMSRDGFRSGRACACIDRRDDAAVDERDVVARQVQRRERVVGVGDEGVDFGGRDPRVARLRRASPTGWCRRSPRPRHGTSVSIRPSGPARQAPCRSPASTSPGSSL